ncbi:hypothetical protein [Pedobacter sp. MW01-1-1]|uniref:hypothetical protein n=1 Tax=Pedobacter sp. MW01-1-1 TaxID=3383027 RepID=UPI003FEF60E4
MKKNNLLFALVIGLMSVVLACTPEVNEEEYRGTKAILDKPVKYEQAIACLKKYQEPLNVSLKKTEYVGFNKEALQTWLKSIDTVGTYDTIRVSFGRYTPKILEDNGKDPKFKNRLTIFFFPYNGNKPAVKDKVKGLEEEFIDPFNMGEVHP